MKNTLYFIVSCCMPVAVALEGCSYPTHTEDHAAMKKIAPLEGQTWSANDAANEYSYVVSICASADPTNPTFKTAGVIQTELTEKRRSFSVGDTQYASIMGGDEWVQLEYRNGTQYEHKCSHQHRRAHIMIVCDAQVPQGLLKVIEENTNKTEDCYYLFELRHAAMCYQNPDSGLSAGSVICIVFITVVGLYLIGGFIYQRLVVGAKGWEQLPNYSFWQDFGNLQADGCDLVCRTRSKSASREYRGIGDDQLRDDDVGRDDSLLPM